MKKIRVGLIGLGCMGLHHFNTYRKIANAEVVAIADIDSVKRSGDITAISSNLDIEKGKNILDFSGISVYETGFDLLKKADVDLVDICTPTPWHAELAIAALKAGKNVMSEKPLARTLEQAQAIGEALKTAKGQLNIGLCLRAWPAYRYVFEHFKAGDFGKMRSAVLRRISPTLATDTGHWKNWFMNAEFSGGALLDLHLHDTDAICYFFGRPKAVSSIGLNLTSDNGIDQVITNYHYDDGTLVVAEGNWGAAPHTPFEMGFNLIFEKCTALLKDDAFNIYWEDGRVETPELDKRDAYEIELQYLVDCVQNGERADKYQTFADVLDSFKVVMTEQASVEANGRRLDIAY